MTDDEFSDFLTAFSQFSLESVETLSLISNLSPFFYAARRYISLHPFEQAKIAAGLVQAVATCTNHPEHHAFAQWCQGILYSNRQPRQALEHAVQALNYFHSTGQTEYEGRILIGYAHQLNLMGYLAEAKAALLQAIECLLHIPDYPDRPVLYINLAHTQILQGHYAEAIISAQQAEEEAQRLDTLLPNAKAMYCSMRSRALNNQALATLFLGRLSEAKEIFQRALEQANLGNWVEDAGRAELNLVRIAIEKGELFAALKGLRNTAKYFAEAENELEMATVAIEEAMLYEKLVMPDRALTAAMGAATAFAKAEIPAECVEANLVGARLALKQGLESKALVLLTEAQKYLTQAPSIHQMRWRGYRAHPQFQHRTIEKVQALQVVQEVQAQLYEMKAISEALEIRLLAAQLQNDLNPSDAQPYFEQIIQLAQQHEMTILEQQACEYLAQLQTMHLAVPTWKRAIALANHIRAKMPVEELKARLLTDHASLYVGLIEAQLKCRQRRDATISLLEAKGGIWLDLAAPAYAVDPPLERIQAKIQLTFWQQEIIDAVTTEYNVYCKNKIDEAERALVEASRQQRRLRQPLPLPTIDEIQAALLPETCLLEYMVGKTHIWCCVIQAGKAVQWRQLCKRQDVENALSQLYGITRTMQQTRTLEQRRRLAQGYQVQTTAILFKLYGYLLAPLAKIYANYRKLVIAPDGQLYGVPWAALYNGNAYVSEQFVITLTPSSVLMTLKDSALSADVTSLNNTPYVLGYIGEPPLQFLEAELNAVCEAFPDALIVNPASSQDLQSITAPSILHLSAHGESNATSPLLSFLLLADDKFYLDDILNLSIHGTQLVTLSACETGKTPVVGGSLLALAGAFLCAGANMTLSSLWAVDDETTQVLMRHFYHRLCTGATSSHALQAAQKEMRLAGHTHPFYWAAFQLFGRSH